MQNWHLMHRLTRISKCPVFCIHPAGVMFCATKIWHPNWQMTMVLKCRIPRQDRGNVGNADSILSLSQKYVDEIRSMSNVRELCLVGFSFGGVVASQMADMLYKTGVIVRSITIIDTKLVSEQYLSFNDVSISAIEHFIDFLRSLDSPGLTHSVLKESNIDVAQCVKSCDKESLLSSSNISPATICQKVWESYNFNSLSSAKDIGGLQAMISFVVSYVSHVTLMKNDAVNVAAQSLGGVTEDVVKSTFIAAEDTSKEDIEAWKHVIDVESLEKHTSRDFQGEAC